MKILIIEDEKELSESIVAYLTAQDYSCDIAINYQTALYQTEYFDYDCILLDITLPGGSGLRILEQLKENNKTDGVLIISAKNSLSRLNQSLLLLTKIDNSLFIENEIVNISKILSNYINNFEELISSKNICIDKNIKPGVNLVVNKALAETLVSNIMTNTIKHNYQNGKIDVELNDTMLSVSNTGKEPLTATNELFERFKKEATSADSLGLGLAIVKKICDTYGFPVSYTYAVPMHTIRIYFNTSL